MPEAYPFLLRPILMPKVWGGRRLSALGKSLPEAGSAPGSHAALIGESWELADLGATSAGGGGGGAARSIVDNGSFAGRALGEAMEKLGSSLLGRVKASESGGFPLLVKYLDAREHLSVQVHPSIAYCKSHADAHLKTECWHILAAEPGSVLFKGVKPGVGRGDFERALREPGTQGSGVVDLLEAVPAVVGDCHLLPSGTVHALGAGVLVAEVQTPSDTTFRVYDWAKEYGRAGRELHIEASLECISWERARDATRFGRGVSPASETCTTLVSTGFFDVDELRAAGGAISLAAGDRGEGRPQVVMMIQGTGTIEGPGRESIPMALGQTALIPAAIADTTSLRLPAGTSALRAIVR
jgi:mannose-6-phosphate isomerase